MKWSTQTLGDLPSSHEELQCGIEWNFFCFYLRLVQVPISLF